MKKSYKRKKRGPVRAKKTEYDGIKFASGLEVYMYKALKEARIVAEYEPTSYTLLNGFDYEGICFEKQANGKGEYKDRGCKKILPIKYKPDFDTAFEMIGSSSTNKLILYREKSNSQDQDFNDIVFNNYVEEILNNRNYKINFLKTNTLKNYKGKIK